MTKEKDLLELKQKIDDAKTKVSELKGQQKLLVKELDETWGCKDIQEAEVKIDVMEGEIKTLEGQIEKGLKKLEEEYEL